MKKTLYLGFILIALFFVTACNGTTTSLGVGQNLAIQKGCAACHSVDNTDKVGPTWVGLYGSQVELTDGTFITADDEYLIESIKDPDARTVKDFSKESMPLVPLTDDELNTLVTYIKSVK